MGKNIEGRENANGGNVAEFTLASGAHEIEAAFREMLIVQQVY